MDSGDPCDRVSSRRTAEFTITLLHIVDKCTTRGFWICLSTGSSTLEPSPGAPARAETLLKKARQLTSTAHARSLDGRRMGRLLVKRVGGRGATTKRGPWHRQCRGCTRALRSPPHQADRLDFGFGLGFSLCSGSPTSIPGASWTWWAKAARISSWSPALMTAIKSS